MSGHADPFGVQQYNSNHIGYLHNGAVLEINRGLGGKEHGALGVKVGARNGAMAGMTPLSLIIYMEGDKIAFTIVNHIPTSRPPPEPGR